jgi:phosphatidylserine/phosphatidylglycerophosphate/cardiolipin synthase-like enzyme
VKLIVQPNDGINPLLRAVQRATKSIEVVVFRLDRVELEKAFAAAVTRGVSVRLLVASTNGGKEKALRKLEKRLLEGGITVTRTADDLPRYHGKMAIIDGALFVLGFNFTRQDIERSRSFGLVTRDKTLVKEASRLFEADSTRQPYAPGEKRLVVSPESSRQQLTKFIGSARKQLLIYDNRVSDKLMLRLLRERVEAGVEIRMIGRIDKHVDGLSSRQLSDLRMHVRTIVRDGASVFVLSNRLY